MWGFIESVIHWEGIDEQGHHVTDSFLGDQSAFRRFYKQESITVLTTKKTYHVKLKKNKICFVNAFTKDLANALSGGLSLTDALSLLHKKQNHSTWRSIIADLEKQLSSGKSLSEALSHAHHYFSKTYIALIYAAEKTHQLPTILKQLSLRQDFTERLKNKLTKALMYPASVLVFTVLLTWGLMTFAIPQFQSIFANFNAPLPLATQYIIALTECLRKYHYLIMISSGALPISFLCCYRSFDHIKRYTQDALLRLPFIGTVYRFKLVAQWTNILALTLKSGMRLQEALLLANNTLTHLSLKTSCHTLIHKVTSGHKLHQALAQITFFNTSERYLIEMGETTTTLPLVLERISQESLNSIEHKLDSLSKWIEPVIMLLLAGIAGSLIITMYLPIFKIGTLL